MDEPLVQSGTCPMGGFDESDPHLRQGKQEQREFAAGVQSEGHYWTESTVPGGGVKLMRPSPT